MHRFNYSTKNEINAKLHQKSDAFIVSITHKRPLPVPFLNNAFQTPVKGNSADHTEYRDTQLKSPIYINMPTRSALVLITKYSVVSLVTNLNNEKKKCL